MKNQFKSKRTQLLLIGVLAAFLVGIGLGLLIPRTVPLHISLPARTTSTTPALIGISYGDTLPGDSTTVLAQTLNDAVAVGITTIRLDLAWNDIQPNSASTYNWTNFDRVVIAARSKNLTLLPILDYTPAWARATGCTTPKCAPADPNAFALFAAAASTRYAPMGIHTWEIWNEPNIVGFWQPAPNVADYVQLLSATSAAIKAADPQSFIVSGGLAPSGSSNGNIAPLDFFTQFANLGGIPLVDAIGAHPYSYPMRPAYNKWNSWQQMAGSYPGIESIENILVAHGAASKKIWLTEYGAPTNGPGAGATSSNYNFALHPTHVDEALQAQMATDSVLLARSLSYIGALYWYSYKDLGTTRTTIEHFFGLRRFDGSAKPAWQSLHNAIVATNASANRKSSVKTGK